MSIKIHHGYRLSPTLHMGNILPWAAHIRPQLRQVAQHTLARDLIERASEVVDRAVLQAAGLVSTVEGREVVEVPALQYANAKQSEDRKEIQQGHRKPGVDVNLSLLMVPHHTGLYALLDADNEHTIAAFRSLPDVEHFPYDNSSDAPKGHSQEAWEARGALWKDILGPSGRASERGATIALVDLPFGLMSHEMPPIETLDDTWLPKFKQRVFDATLMSSAGAPTEAVKQDLDKGSFAEFLGHMARLRRGEDPAFERMREQVEAVLPRTYARAWLDMTPDALAAVVAAQISTITSRQPGPKGQDA